MHGLPITLKDSYETAGLRTVCGRTDLRTACEPCWAESSTSGSSTGYWTSAGTPTRSIT
ncbi:hypothetical protein ACFW93_36405 [Streptomyces canus]|uniref:hypothetical protein n=1 Tax=Streptomyces canus TaxID=58343 RepID=UPI00367B70E5